jgi:photosystem II stability/assembly factor-like uncharacterized protein
MKNILFIVLIIILSNYTYAQLPWVQTNGPEGSDGIVGMVSSNGGKIWVISGNGIYSSQNNGQLWNRVKSEIYMPLNILASNDTIVLAFQDKEANMSSYNFKIITSIDNGVTWSTPINSFGMHAQNIILKNGKLYCFVDTGPMSTTVYISNNLGLTFTTKNITGGNFIIYSAKGKGIVYTTVSPSVKTFVTFDDFTTATYLNLPNALYAWSAIEKDSVIVLTGYDYNTNSNLGFRTTDLGNTYAPLSIAGPNVFITNLMEYKDTIYAIKFYSSTTSVSDTLFYSIDKGLSWSGFLAPKLLSNLETSAGLMMLDGRHMIAYASNGKNNKKLAIYDIVSDIPQYINLGIKASFPYWLESVDSTLYCGTKEGVYKTTDGGDVWQDISPDSTGNDNYLSYCFRRDTLIQSSYYGNTYYSFNKGNTWSSMISNNRYVSNFLNNTCFADSVFTTDYGITWQNSYYNGHVVHATRMVRDSASMYAIDTFGNIGAASSLLKFDFGSNTWTFIDTITVGNIVSHDSLYLTERISKIGNLWYTYGYTYGLDSNRNYKGFCYSLNGADWNVCNTNTIVERFPIYNGTVHLSKPFTYNNMYFNTLYDEEICYSINGVDWYLLGNGLITEDFRFASLGAPTSNRITSHQGSLYTRLGASGVWKLSDSLKLYAGKVFIDSNNNAIQDPNDLSMKNWVISTKYSVTNSDSNGSYQLLSVGANDTLRATKALGFLTNPDYIEASTTSTYNNDFAMHAPVSFQNLSVDIAGNIFRPGFSADLYVKVKSLGTLNQNDTLTLLLDTMLSSIIFDIMPNLVNGNVYKWAIPTLLPFTDWNLKVTANTATNAVIGDTLTCMATVDGANVDIDSIDNFYLMKKIIVGSYDPNEKICLNGPVYNLINLNSESLVYEIHFQNEGTYNTDFVKIVDTLSNKLNFSSFKFLNSSHPVTYTIKNGILTFIFNPLQLTPKAINEQGSMGFIKYSVLPKATIKNGDTISNTAHIYFDYNNAIVTNTTKVNCKYIYPTKFPVVKPNSNKLDLYPNPSSDFIIVKSNALTFAGPAKVLICDLQGKVLLTKQIISPNTKINIKSLLPGSYLVHYYLQNGQLISIAQLSKL